MRQASSIDRRWVFLAVAVALTGSLLAPQSLRAPATAPVSAVFDHIESLPSGSHVVLCFNYAPGTKAELHPMAAAVLHHCYRKGVIPIGMAMATEGAGMAKLALEDTAKSYGKKAGKDFVVLGYKPGWQSVIISMGEDMYSAFPADTYGTPTKEIHALEGVRSLKDVGLVLDLATSTSAETWVVYGYEKYGVPVAAGCTAVVGPGLYPFLQTQQLVGLLAGMKGAAEYEDLVARPSDATQAMLPQSAVHLLIVALIVLGNASYFRMRRRR